MRPARSGSDLVFGAVNRRTSLLRNLAGSLILQQHKHPLRVAVDGITASGKTTLGNELASAIGDRGRPVIRIRMDDFHHRREHRYRQGKDSARGYYEDAYDFDALEHHVLRPLGPNGTLAFRRRIIDLGSDAPVDEPAELAAPNSILIVDGSFMQRHHRSDWDVVIFVNTSFDEALRRGIARDAAQFGSPAEASQRYAHRYHAASRMYIDEVDPARAADLIIDNDDPSTPRLRRVGGGNGTETLLADAQPRWHRTGERRFPFAARQGGRWWVLRLNVGFPAHDLYTLFVDGRVAFDVTGDPDGPIPVVANIASLSTALSPVMAESEVVEALGAVRAFADYGSEHGDSCSCCSRSL